MRLHIWRAVVFALTTTADSETDFKVLVFGDYGSKHESAGTNVKAMAQLMAKQGWDTSRAAAVVTGDNFYPDGVTANTVHDRFDAGFRERFGPQFAFPFYVTAGDHDHRGDPEVLLVLGTRDARWVMPSLNHAQRVELGGGRSALFLLVDAPSLAGDFGRAGNSRRGAPGAGQRRVQGWEWLEQQLEAADATYVFVVGHFPVESPCKHGPQTRGGYAAKMRAVLGAHNVTGYLAGHDHCQALVRSGSTFHAVSGLGGESAYALSAAHLQDLRSRGHVAYSFATARSCAPEEEAGSCQPRPGLDFRPTKTPAGFGVLTFRGGGIGFEFYQSDAAGIAHQTFRTDLVKAELVPPPAGGSPLARLRAGVLLLLAVLAVCAGSWLLPGCERRRALVAEYGTVKL